MLGRTDQEALGSYNFSSIPQWPMQTFFLSSGNVRNCIFKEL
jgi:hypothetical protein